MKPLAAAGRRLAGRRNAARTADDPARRSCRPPPLPLPGNGRCEKRGVVTGQLSGRAVEVVRRREPCVLCSPASALRRGGSLIFCVILTDMLHRLLAWPLPGARHVGSTKMNAESSRSHLVFSVLITSLNTQTGKVCTRGRDGRLSFWRRFCACIRADPGRFGVARWQTTRGKISLVDLAGSERVGKTGASADR